MRILVRSYDLDDLGGSGVTLRAVARWLESRGENVWTEPGRCGLETVRRWAPDLVIGQQWATGEAEAWASALRVPFVMLVHGPGQFEYFMPLCDLAAFNAEHELELARGALGSTPAMVLHPPVFRAEYETPGEGDYVTLIGCAPHKGLAAFLAVAEGLPERKFLLVGDGPPSGLPPNVEPCPKTADMRSVYARTRLLLMPSEREPYGRVAVEAAMSGIPVVASDLPGIREATAGLVSYVAAGSGWALAVREALDNMDAHREGARRLRALRDPEPELQAFHEKLREAAAAGRRRPTLSLVMTVSNEASTLERAIDSVRDIADAIIIGVHRKSSDETAAIARRRATDFFEFDETSPPDFPRMRNRAMERVGTDWALVLDGHEWIDVADRIPAALNTTAWSIEIRTNYEPDEQGVPAAVFPFPRIHRRHVRFAGAPAHEEISTPLDRRLGRPDIAVWHERRPGAAASARLREKNGAEIEGLRAAWLTNGDRRALFYMANGLRDAGCHAEAAAAYEEYLKMPNYAEEAWQARLYLGRCRTALGDWPSARQCFERAVLESPERAEASAGLGHVLLAAGDPRGAAAWFRMAASLPEPAHARLFVEPPVYRWGAWHGLALALDRLQDYHGAADAEARALAGGAGPWAKQNIAMWRARAGAAEAMIA